MDFDYGSSSDDEILKEKQNAPKPLPKPQPKSMAKVAKGEVKLRCRILP